MAQERAADTLKGPAKPVGGWRGGPVKAPDGTIPYCVTQAPFDSGHVLVIGRTRAGEVNLGLRIPGATLPVDQQWPVQVQVDDASARDRTAMAGQPELLVVPLGGDEELYRLLGAGRVLTVTSASDRIAFALKGTAQALKDLRACAADASEAPPPSAAAPAGGGAPFPETLSAILAAAGLREVEVVTFDDVPADERPADFAWRYGPTVGGVRERIVPEGTSLEEMSAEYVEAVRSRCRGTGAATLGAVERLPGVTLRTAGVDCTEATGTVHQALVFYLTDGRVFAAFFHEAPIADRDAAAVIRDNLADVFRHLAKNDPAPAPAPSPAPAAPPPPEPEAATPAAKGPVAEGMVIPARKPAP